MISPLSGFMLNKTDQGRMEIDNLIIFVVFEGFGGYHGCAVNSVGECWVVVVGVVGVNAVVMGFVLKVGKNEVMYAL